jgi:TM2 domain-containing membrane protein YozV
MNCANHPAAAVASYCQYCGKPLCSECVRSVGNVIACEPCLGSRLGIPTSGQPALAPVFPDAHAHPMLAGLLGLIPGVGAMYNGQFVKALAHVLIFAVFVSLSDRSGLFGLFVAAWVFYQVFDAYQTAKARRDGLPLPDPFGLNDLGARMGVPQTPAVPAPYAPRPVSDAPPPPSDPPPALAIVRSRTPAGPIVLIAVGLLLLFQTLGVFRLDWIDRCWPLLIVGLGAWLLYRRTRPNSSGGSQ